MNKYIIAFAVVLSVPFITHAALLGDVNKDGKVTAEDLALVRIANPSVIGDANYNPSADFDNDGVIGRNEIYTVIANMGQIEEVIITPKFITQNQGFSGSGQSCIPVWNGKITGCWLDYLAIRELLK